MKKKTLLMLVIIAAGILLAVTFVSDDSDAETVYPTIGDFTYSLDPEDTTAVLLEYIGTDETVVIPGSIVYSEKNYDVVRIGVGAFANKEVTSVTIPDGVTEIGESAFSNCNKLTSIAIPSSVSFTEYRCFASCDNLTTVTFGPDSVLETLGDASFVECHKLATITLPDNLVEIGRFTLKECNSLTTINIPDGVTEIEEEAFMDCSNLATVSFGASAVTTIDGGAFSGCTSLAIPSIPATVTSIGYSAFANTAISTADLSNVTTLGGAAFQNCKSLTSAILNDGLTEIRENLFDGCENLPSITIPATVTSIKNSAFEGCKSLTSVAIPDGVTTIGAGAFQNCESLTSIVIPDSVTSIGEYTFDGCKGATTLTIGSGLLEIPSCAFENLKSLESVTIPGNVKDIDYTFNGCTILSSVTFQEGVETISGFDGCAFATVTFPNSVTQVKYFGDNENLATVNIGAGLTGFGDYRPFQHCPALSEFTVVSGNPNFCTADGVLYSDGGSKLCLYPQGKTDVSFSIPSQVSAANVTAIGNRAFMDNPYLENITIPEGVTTIEEHAIMQCYLKSISFPDSLTTVESVVAYCLDFYYNDTSTEISQTAENLKGKMWCGNGKTGNIASLYYFDSVQFTVTFRSDSTVVKEIQTNNYGKLSEALPTPPEKQGYTFKGWFTSIPSGTLVTTDTVFTKDSNVYADWEYTPGVVTGVSLDKTSNTIDVGGEFTLVATVTPSDAPNKDVTWSSSNTSVATVDDNGKVVGVSKGTVTITVTTVDGGKTATCSVTVGTSPSPGPSDGGVNIGLIIGIIILVLVAAGVVFYVVKKKNDDNKDQ